MEPTENEFTHPKSVKRFTAEQREELLSRYQQSGLTRRAFVARERIGLSTLTKWLRQQRPGARSGLKPVQFQQVLLSGSGPRWAVEIVSPQNWTLRLAQAPHPGALQHLVRSLPC